MMRESRDGTVLQSAELSRTPETQVQHPQRQNTESTEVGRPLPDTLALDISRPLESRTDRDWRPGGPNAKPERP